MNEKQSVNQDEIYDLDELRMFLTYRLPHILDNLAYKAFSLSPIVSGVLTLLASASRITSNVQKPPVK